MRLGLSATVRVGSKKVLTDGPTQFVFGYFSDSQKNTELPHTHTALFFYVKCHIG